MLKTGINHFGVYEEKILGSVESNGIMLKNSEPIYAGWKSNFHNYYQKGPFAENGSKIPGVIILA